MSYYLCQYWNKDIALEILCFPVEINNEPINEIVGLDIFRIGEIIEDKAIIFHREFFVFNDELTKKTDCIGHDWLSRLKK